MTFILCCVTLLLRYSLLPRVDMARRWEKKKLPRSNGPFGIGQQSQKCLMMIARELENAGVVVSFCCSDETECD